MRAPFGSRRKIVPTADVRRPRIGGGPSVYSGCDRRDAGGDRMPSTVEVMAEAFHEAGTPVIVGHPGGESVELMEASHKRGMRFILVKQESAGAMLAATWGDITGSPGICMSTRAPGAANMVNGVTHAWMDRSPLIA